MKLSAATALFLTVIVCIGAWETEIIGGISEPKTFVNYHGTEWVGNVQCVFSNESDCSLSIHTNGRRIDGSTHEANEEVFVFCLTTTTSIDLVIHNFTFAQVQDYTCLEDVTKEAANKWLNAAPVIEASGSFIHGQPLSITCNAPPGCPLYWVLPGPSANHQGAVIIDTSNAVNASTTVTFILNNTDHFASYKCCIGFKSGQPPYDTCTSYTVVDSDSDNLTTTTANYKTPIFHFTVQVYSVLEPDVFTIQWLRCWYIGNCVLVESNFYTLNIDRANSLLTTEMAFVDTYSDDVYTFTFNTTDNSADYTFNFNVARGYYYPLITQQPSIVYYKPDDGTLSVTLKFTIDANPAPTFTWSKQHVHEESIGSEKLVTGGRYVTSISSVTSTRWEAMLLIRDYNETQDDAIFTLHAENVYGANWIDADTSVGPSYLNLVRTSNSSLSFKCEIESFPNPPIYEINVLAPYDANYTVVKQTFDAQSFRSTVYVDVGLDSRNTYFQLSCTASNPYNSSTYLEKNLTTFV